MSTPKNSRIRHLVVATTGVALMLAGATGGYALHGPSEQHITIRVAPPDPAQEGAQLLIHCVGSRGVPELTAESGSVVESRPTHFVDAVKVATDDGHVDGFSTSTLIRRMDVTCPTAR